MSGTDYIYCRVSHNMLTVLWLSANASSHRLSTIMNADRIIVVENGEILEQGNHDELIVAGGRYADLWSKQVFVRTKEEDKDASAGQAGFVNDLSSEQTKTELSKVNKPITSAKEETKPAKVKDSAEEVTVTPTRKQEVVSAEEK